MANIAISMPRPSLHWGKIVLCALLAAILAMGIILLLFWLHPPFIEDLTGYLISLCEYKPDTGNIIGDAIALFFACAFQFFFMILLGYFVLAFIMSAILIQFMVRERRMVHSLLAALISIPIAALFYGLLTMIFG